MKHAKPRLRYKTIRKKRFRMRGGVGENLALRVFGWVVSDGAEYLGQLLTRFGLRLAQREAGVVVGEVGVAAGRAAGEVGVAAGRAAAEAGVAAGRAAGEAGVAAGRAAGEAGVAAGRAAQQLFEQFSLSAIPRFGQAAVTSTMAAFTAAVPAILSAGGAVATAAFQGLARNPQSGRRAIGILRQLFSLWREGIAEAAEVAGNAAARGAPPLRSIGPLVRAGEGPVGNAVAAGLANVGRVVRPPIPTTGKLSLDFVKDLIRKDDKGTSTLIRDFFNAPDNINLKIPSGVKGDLLRTAVKAGDKVLAQKKAFFETLVSNGRIQGTPAEILAEASEILGETTAKALLEPVANPFLAAIKAIPEGTGRAQAIAEYLEKIAAEEAKLIADARAATNPGEKGIQGMMSKIMDSYNYVLGRDPQAVAKEILKIPSSNVAHVLRTGVTESGIADYALWLRNAQSFFQNQMSTEGLVQFKSVMNREAMSQFRQGMIRLCAHNPAEAAAIFENFALNVVPRLTRVNTGALSEFLSVMRSNPAGVQVALDALLDRLGRQALSLQGSADRALTTLPARLLGYAIRGGVGATGLFIVTLQGTPNGGGMKEVAGKAIIDGAGAARDRIYEWFGVQLWENPPPDNEWGKTLATAGGFGSVAAMTAWLAAEGRKWLWSFMGGVIVSLGLTAQQTASRVIAYFRGTPDGTPVTKDNPLTPPPEGAPLTPGERTELNASLSETSGGRRKKRRTVRKYR